VSFTCEDHDGMHLFNRADRFLPNGYCLLQPMQKCEKGNACLTCGVFVTDGSHTAVLQRQLDETKALIERTTTQFQVRHGKSMPSDNVWLVQRTAERDALTAAARRKSESKAKAVDDAIRRLIKRGVPITFQQVQREAGVSHSFLYSNPTLRRRIEQLREEHTPRRGDCRDDGDDANVDSNVVFALTAEIARLKKSHRQEVKALREALEQAHGENLALRRELAHRGWTGPPPVT
jgi:hypothetical protein